MKIGIRELILVACLVAMPLGAWWFAFRPQNAQVEAIGEQIAVKQDKLRTLNQMTATIGDLEKEIEALHEALAFFESKLPSEKEIDKVLQETWQLAEANRLTTKSIRTMSRDQDSRFTLAGGPHAEQPIAVHLVGDFDGLYAFLQALEAQPRIMRVQTLNLTKFEVADDSPDHGLEKIRAHLVLSVFFEKSEDSQP